MQAHSAVSLRLSNASSAPAVGLPSIHRLLFAAATVGLLFAGQALAQDAEDADSAEVVAPAKLDRNGKVCEFEVVTGSRMKKKVCHTPEQWEARERAGKELARELDNRTIHVPKVE